MRRLRVVIAATALLVGTVILFAQQQHRLPDAYRTRWSYGGPDDGDSSSVPEHTGADDNRPWSDPLPSEAEPLAVEVPVNPNSQDTSIPQDPPSGRPALGDDHTPMLPSTSELQLPADPTANAPTFQAEFQFQKDLDLELPIDVFKKFSSNKPHNYNPSGPKGNAYATFMATRNPSLKDPYYMAIHSLVYRVLWSARSRTEQYPLIVFVADFVTPEQRQLLTGAGAIVRELSPLEWNPNVPGIQHRWKDLFAKLNMWNETNFSRILFLDADALPVTNIDVMFDMAPLQECISSKLEPDDFLLDGTKACEAYVFAGVPQDPFNVTDVNINVGSMVFTPSSLMHQRLLQNYAKFDRYDPLMAEQAFLNWQFSITGAFPPKILEREWGGFFPNEDDEGKLKIVHEKLWTEERRWLKEEWLTQWQEMLLCYSGDEFAQQRFFDGLAS